MGVPDAVRIEFVSGLRRWQASAIGRLRLSGDRIDAGDAGEAVHAVVRRRLQLVPVVHAVIALELRVVGRVGVASCRCCTDRATAADP